MLARITLAGMWLLHFLPLRWLAIIGEGLGVLLYLLVRERRRICVINLARCFPDLSAKQRTDLAKAHFRVVGRTLLDRAILWWAPRERILQMVSVAGAEHFEACKGAPVILLAPHFVGIDAGWTRLTCEGDFTGMYAKQKNPVFHRRLLLGRMRFGHQRAYSRQEGIRPVVTAIREKIPFFYQPDLDYGRRDAVFVPFFGVPTATITGLSRVARLTGARIIPCVTLLRTDHAGYEVRFYPAWENFPSGDDTADARRMNAFIEQQARATPEQYYWIHRRFKTRPPGETKWY